jgi:hypothetical protein
MKKLITIAMVLAISLAACEQVDELTQFEMDYTTSFTIPGTIGMDIPIDLHTPEIQTNTEEQFSGQDTREDMVEEIILREMDLSIQTPSDGDFSFLNGLTIYLSAEGLEEVKVAWKESIPEDPGSTLQLETASADLKEYLFKDQFQLRLQSRTDEIIDQDHEVRVESVFHVDAKILGQ